MVMNNDIRDTDTKSDFEVLSKFSKNLAESQVDLTAEQYDAIQDTLYEEFAHTEYQETLKSGMLWEFHPVFTGIWEKDKKDFMKQTRSK
jgi:hypothetical protein